MDAWWSLTRRGFLAVVGSCAAVLSGAGRGQLLRFNGVYSSFDGAYRHIRFFDDGRVIETLTVGTAHEIVHWFNETRHDRNGGEYQCIGNTVTFVIATTYTEVGLDPVIVEYTGEIKKGALMLKEFSRTTGRSRSRTYGFVPDQTEGLTTA